MKKLIGFPSIEQFRNIIANINRHYTFVGLDEQGEPIYDSTRPKPVITFTGTVKLHGTNAGISYSDAGGLWAQSRENIITVEKDNAGFAFFVESNKTEFLNLIKTVQQRNAIDCTENIITIFGEWAGGNIQKGVGISNIDKSFFIFGVKVSPIVDNMTEQEKLDKREKSAHWLEDYSYLRATDKRIYNINDYPKWAMEIDFNLPQLKQNELADLTIAVETQCPVAKAFGFEGIGEGIVWNTYFNGLRHTFKVKGEKHSSSKVKVLAAVDTEKLTSIAAFVDSVVTESRVNQAIGVVFPNNEPKDIKKTGDVLRWIVNDIMKEEMDTMIANNIEPKEVNSHILAKARQMFLAILADVSK